MKTLLAHFSILLIVLSSHVRAHDPSEHNETKENPKCEKMKSMDHSKMNSDDPVLLAMKKKCMKYMHHDEDQTGEASEHGQNQKKTEDEHQH